MLRPLPTTPGILFAAALALAGCGQAHGGGADTATSSVPVPMARHAGTAPAGGDPALQGAMTAVPDGACTRKPVTRGRLAPQVLTPDPGDVLMPLIKDKLAAQARGAVDACFAQARAKAPGLSGRLVTSFTLPPEGGVTHAAVEQGVGDDALHRCVAQALQGAALPSYVSGAPLVMTNQVIALCPDGTSAWPTSQGWR